jgi:hypothetical protein
MLINKDYKVELANDLNLVLCHRMIRQESNLTKAENVGKEWWDVIGYYSPTLEGYHTILKKLCTLKLAETSLSDFKTVIKTLEELHDLIGSLKCPAEFGLQ